MGAREPGRGIIRKTMGVVAAMNAGLSREGSMARETPCNWNWEGNATEGHDNGDPLIADEEEAFFIIIALRARGRKQGQCRLRLRGRHLHGSW
jgi:hypothetical protein